MTVLQIHRSGVPMASARIGTREFLELTGLTQAALEELLRMDWILPLRTAQQEFLFLDVDVLRVRRFRRLCADFELNSVAGTIIVDLLERIEQLEARLGMREK